MLPGLGDSLTLISSYSGGFVTTTVVAVEIAIVSILVSWICGLGAALAGDSRIRVLRSLARFYIWFIRGTPVLLQLLFLYNGLPSLGIVLEPVPTAILGLGEDYGRLRLGIRAHDGFLQLAGKGLVEQRSLQFVQRGEFLLVEACEAFGFGGQVFKLCRHRLLFLQRRKRDHELPHVSDVNLHQCSAIRLLTDLALNRFRGDQEVSKVLPKQ